MFSPKIDNLSDEDKKTDMRAAQVKHPVELIQHKHLGEDNDFNLKLRSAVYGSHSALRHTMECSMLAKCGRLPGLPSRYVGLRTMMGIDDTFDFEDYLGVVNPSNDFMRTTLHEYIETKMGL
eukprot:GHVR01025367.1.p1 GENE.GHVR01025367.1~~GHVR01025367.1.p1  ORF type:complete len:122 (+),score=19.53 GHVR01025367.1:27-392(+)